MALQRIGWENGTLVSPAKVLSDGTVQPAQYEGKTPLSATNLKAMENNTENFVNNQVGNLEELNTTQKNNTIGAINEVYKNNVYSNTETVIGKWIDGKNVYRKVIEYTGNLNSQNVNITHNISNFNQIIKAFGFIPFSGKTCYLIGAFENNTNFVNITNIDDSRISLKIGSGWLNSFTNGCKIVLEYTKTVD